MLKLFATLTLLISFASSVPAGQYSCQRSPSIGSPINYIHKAFEKMYDVMYDREISAIPRQILDYFDKDQQEAHFAWYFPSSRISSMLYLTMGSVTSQRPSLENFFWTELDATPNPNSRYNQVLKVLKALRLDGPTRQPTQFILDKGPSEISAYTVECGNIKADFQNTQKQYNNNFGNVVRNFS